MIVTAERTHRTLNERGSGECCFAELRVFWSKGRDVAPEIALAHRPFIQTRSQHAL